MLTLFLAKRFFRPGTDGNDNQKHRASVPAIRIATAGIAVGIAVMIVSVCFVRGFQQEITAKLTGFASHIEITAPGAYSSPESSPLVTDSALTALVSQAPDVCSVQRVAEKLGIFKTETDFTGICLKGISTRDYDTTFLASCIVEGRMPAFSDEESSGRIAISRYLADRLNLKLGQKVYSYFFSNTIKQRRFEVAAIYETHLRQFDKTFVITDLHTVCRLNSWNENQTSGLEVRLNSMDNLNLAHTWLNHELSQRRDPNGVPYSIVNISENPRTATILPWLDLLNFNVVVILAIMMCVAGFSMISGLLILILERTNTIGLLKALGATNRRIRHTFLIYAAFIIGRGIIIGNIIGLLLVALQQAFHIVRLNPETYYVDTAPVAFDWLWIVGLNIVTLAITMLALLAPSHLASRVQPAKAMRFE